MLLDVPLCRNVTRVTATEVPLSMTLVSSTVLTLPLTVPVLIAPRIKNLLPHPHKEARRANTSVSDRRRFTTPPPLGKNSYRDFTPNRLSFRPEPDPERSRRGRRRGGICCSAWKYRARTALQQPALSEVEGPRKAFQSEAGFSPGGHTPTLGTT